MTLPTSGTIKMSQMRTEYTDLGALSQVRLRDFYYGASVTKSYLPKNSCTDAVRANTSHPGYTPHLEGIPAVSSPVGSLPIKLSQFYGKSYYYAPQTDSTISGNVKTFNVNTIESAALKSNTINSAFIDLQVNGEMRATATNNRALTINAKKRSHTTVWVNNTSRILGKGGRGGNGGGSSGSKGQNGGDAFYSSSHTFINNNGKIYGGGGGGGGGRCNNRSYNECYCCNVTNAGVGGGGGGGGKGGGDGGNGGSACAANFKNNGNNGSAANWNDTGGGGSGGSGTKCPSVCLSMDPGGNGGGWASTGGSGNGGGGSGGVAFKKKSGLYMKITKTGSIAGSTSGTF